MKALSLLVLGILIALLPSWCQAGVHSELCSMGSFGISLGAMQWLADSDAREYRGDEYGAGGTAELRLLGKAVFRYRLDMNWLLSMETGFGWNGYPDSGNLVLWVIPTTVGAERRIGEISGFTTSLCFGGGVYVWGQRRGGNFLVDAVTCEKYHATDPGAYLGLGGETHMTDHVTVTGLAAAHYIYSANRDDFKDRLGGDDVFAEIRIGINYYFSPYTGLVSGSAEGK
ncbi:MAG: hypothetical protein KAY24_08710 [Candidatus Eisenbacteria sp.]|nr:hypothetical protein [Candidatus Eisenbacteria bacterium]